MKHTIPKSWALSISNTGVAVAVIAALLLTGNYWVLVGLGLIPLNLFVWWQAAPGIMVIECGDDREVEVVLDIKDRECGDKHGRHRGHHGHCPGDGRGSGRIGNPPVAA
jgi:hypothetical protein